MRMNAGDRVRWRGEECLVIIVRSEFVTLETQDGEEIDVAFDVATADMERVIAPAFDRVAVDELGESVAREVRIWKEAIERLDSAQASGVPRGEALDHEARRVGDAMGRTISVRTLERRISSYRRNGLSGLADKRTAGLRAAQNMRVDPRVIALIDEVLTGRKRASTTSASAVIEEVSRRARREFGEGISLPSRSSFYRLLGTLDRGRSSFGSAKTRESLSLRPDDVFTSVAATRPGEQVQIDSTVLDVMVRIDESTVARPELTIMVDVATRSILSAILRPAGTKGVDIVIALARALVPYSRRPEGARETRRLISTLWADDVLLNQERYERARMAQPFIFPDSITTDRGRNFLSRDFRAACDHLDISYVTASPHTPTDKAHVERTFKSINTLFLQYLKGYVGRSVEHRGKDATIDSNSLLTIAQMQELLEDWIAVDWQNRPHDGLRHPTEPRVVLSPNQMFRAFRSLAPELHVPLTERDFIRMLPTIHRRINQYGVTIDHRVYDSSLLSPYRRRKSNDRRNDGKWRLRVDPYNLHVVWLDDNGELIPLFWANHVHSTPMLGDVWRTALEQYRQGVTPEAADREELVEGMKTFAANGNAARAKVSKEQRRRARTKAVAADPMSAERLTSPAVPVEGDPELPGSADFAAETEVEASWPHSGGFVLITHPTDGFDDGLGD